MGLNAGPVWLIGPESRTYHVDPNCPALRRPDRYWPVDRAVIAVDGTIIGQHGNVYKRRNRCKRCGAWTTVGAEVDLTPRGKA